MFFSWSSSSSASTSSESLIFSDVSSVNSISISLISFFSFVFCCSLQGIDDNLISFILLLVASFSFSSSERLRFNSSINMLYLAFLTLSFSRCLLCINRGMIFCSMMKSWYDVFPFLWMIINKMISDTIVDTITTIQKEQNIPTNVFATVWGRLK